MQPGPGTLKLLFSLELTPSLVADVQAPRGQGARGPGGRADPLAGCLAQAFAVQNGGTGGVRRRCLAEAGCRPGCSRCVGAGQAERWKEAILHKTRQSVQAWAGPAGCLRRLGWGSQERPGGCHRLPAVSSSAVGALGKLTQPRTGTGLGGGPAPPPGPLHCLMRHSVPPFQRALITPFL